VAAGANANIDRSEKDRMGKSNQCKRSTARSGEREVFKRIKRQVKGRRVWSCAIEIHKCRIKGFEFTVAQSYRSMQFGLFLLSDDEKSRKSIYLYCK